MRYYRGEGAIARPLRFCRDCSEKGIEVVGEEKHVIYDCPTFTQERAELLEQTKDTVKNWHLKGCLKLECESAADYAKRRKEVIADGIRYRTNPSWQVILSNVNIQGFFRGWWSDIVMPVEGYREAARHLGRFMHVIEEKKRLQYERLGLTFENTVIHGSLDDLN